MVSHSFSLPAALAAKLKAIAHASGKEASQVLAEILEEYFDDMERDAHIAAQVLAERNTSVPFSDVKKNLGLEN